MSSNYRPSMVGNSYWDYSVPSSPVQKYNLGYIIKNYDADARTIGGRTPEKYFDDSLNGAAKNVINILKNVADIIREANPDALIVISTLFCNYTGGIAEFPEGFTFEGLTDAEKLEAADEMADYYFRKYFEQANEGIKAFAANYDNVVVLDDSNIIPQQVRSGDITDYMNVGHPKAAGYQLLSDGMVSLIREYYGEDSPSFTHVVTTNASATTVESSTTTTTKSTITTKEPSAEDITEMLFSEDYFTLSDNTANLAFGASYEGYKQISGSISDGKGVTMTSKVQLQPGVYDTTLYARARGARALVDVEVNGTVIGSSVDTSNTALGTDNNAPASLSSITIPETTYVTIKITGRSAGSIYLNSLKFIKTADYPSDTPSSSTTTTTQKETSTTTTSKTTTTTKKSAVGEETKLIFNEDTFTLSDNTADFAFSTSDGIPNIFGKISAGKGVTMTSKVQLEPGIYDLTIYARARAVRPAFDIEVNGTVVGKSVDTSNTVLGTNNDAPATLSSITIPATTYITIKITGSEGISTSWLYLNSLKFTKTADVPSEDTSLEVKSTMENGASIRLGSVNGIRFYTTVDTAKIAELKAAGATVEMGTLIAPKDLIGDSELTFNLDAGKYVDVAYKASEYYTEGNFTGIVGSIVNIKEANTAYSAENGNIAREFVGRGYVKVTKDGKTTITYADYSDGNISNNSRSLAYVSYKLVQNTEIFNQYSKDIQEKVEKWAGLYTA